MRLTAESALGLARLVGTPYAEMNCWALIRFAFATQDVELPADPFEATGTLFRKFSESAELRPWDVIGLRNHRILVNHAGLYLGDGLFIHSMQDVGVVVQPLSRRPWNEPGRVAEYHRLLASELP